MPYRDPDRQREFQRRAAASKRRRFTAGQCCVDCGSTERLELDHIDPAQKESHRIWTWSDARIRAEIAKCEWRCHGCHVERHAALWRKHGIGGYKRGCRCDVCRVAKSESNARYRASRPGPGSNGGLSLCRGTRSHSATGPSHENPIQMELFDAA